MTAPPVVVLRMEPEAMLATVSEVVVASPRTAPVAFKKVEVAEVKFARVAKRLVEVAFVVVEIPIVSPPLTVEEAVERKPLIVARPVLEIEKSEVVAFPVEEATSNKRRFVSPLFACIQSFENGEVEPTPTLPADAIFNLVVSCVIILKSEFPSPPPHVMPHPIWLSSALPYAIDAPLFE